MQSQDGAHAGFSPDQARNQSPSAKRRGGERGGAMTTTMHQTERNYPLILVVLVELERVFVISGGADMIAPIKGADLLRSEPFLNDK